MRGGKRANAGQIVKRAIGRRVKIDGHTFDSFGEGRRYEELKLLLMAGAIEWLKVHPRYPLIVAGVEICTYVADFEYRDRQKPALADGTYPVVIEDYKEFTVKTKLAVGKSGAIVKRKQTNPDWKLAELKIRLLEAITGARVVIVTKAG